MDQSKIGSFLKELRKEKGLTQEQLAEKFNVAARTVSRWENGKNMPDISILVEIADFYDIDIRDIINGERKSEDMTEEMKDTLTTVADYSDAEKENIMKKLRFSIIGCIVVFACLLISRMFHLETKHDTIKHICDIMTQIGVILSCQGFINILKIKGEMSKNRFKKLRTAALAVGIAAISPCFIVIFLLVTYMPRWNVRHTEKIEGYDLGYLIDTYSGDLGSDLSVFPYMSDVPEDSVYYDDLSTNMYDTDAVIMLDCSYDEQTYEKEIDRLSSLYKTIEKDGEKCVNHVIYDEEQYIYPAYITIDGFGHTYEYALTDETAHRITYVHLSYPGIDEAKDIYPAGRKDIVKKDAQAYDNENMDAYSMYNHSFDGGKSYTEYDDGNIIMMEK